jgi:hypothetical protein
VQRTKARVTENELWLRAGYPRRGQIDRGEVMVVRFPAVTGFTTNAER